MKKTLLFSAFLIIVYSTVCAQVGINTNTPRPSSVLDIVAKPEAPGGVLLPAIDENARMKQLKDIANHYLVAYDKDVKKLVVYDSLKQTWQVINPWEQNIENDSKTSDIVTDKSVQVDTLKANVLRGSYVPIGGIIMYSGSLNNFDANGKGKPGTDVDGWALCIGDAETGTPDLRGRFIVGYDGSDSDYNAIEKVGPRYTDADGFSDGKNTKDAKKIRLRAEDSGLPVHNHPTNDPGHNHSYTDQYRDGGKEYGIGKQSPAKDIQVRYTNTYSSYTGITIQNNSARNAQNAHENRPPFLVLAFIMKL